MKFNDYFKLKDMTLNITNSCNLNCSYCFEHNKNGKKMTIEDGQKILDICYNNHKLHYGEDVPFVVNFFGGEPFLNFELIETLLKYSKTKKYNITFGVTTNLTILTEHMIDIIEEYELGLLVSIDGIKEIHDRNRCNSYNIVSENVHKLVQRGLKYLIEARMTILPNDVNKLLESIQCISDMGISDIAPVPVTDVYWSDDDLNELKNSLISVWEWLFEKYNDENNKKNISIKFVEDYIESMLMLKINEFQTKVCSAGTFTSCSIGVEGNILPCHQRHTVDKEYNNLVMGNILQDSDIKEIEFNNETISGAFDCNDCIAKSICKGGCPSENLTKNGNGNQMNETQCLITIIMASVAMLFQYKLMTCDNIRSHRLNVIKQNLMLMEYLMEEVLILEPTSREYMVKLMTFYEKMVDMEQIILPSFQSAIEKVLERLVNINSKILEDL